MALFAFASTTPDENLKLVEVDISESCYLGVNFVNAPVNNVTKKPLHIQLDKKKAQWLYIKLTTTSC